MARPDDVDPALGALVRLAVDDLAARLDVPVDAIAVVSAQPVRWPDRSCGCPQPGMVYPQVMVDGTRIELSAGAALYEYHQGGARQPFLCGEARPSSEIRRV